MQSVMNYTKVNFLIKRDSVEKRIFKLFTDKSGDIFILFPYCISKEYYAGLDKIPAHNNKSNLEPIIKGNNCKIPVKFSYHQDGQIHFKPENSIKLNKPLSYKLASIKGVPFSHLNGDHIFTLEIEGLDYFKDFVPKKKNELYRCFEVPTDSLRYKFVFYGGLSEEQIKGRYKGCKILTINRGKELTPLQIGIYFKPYKNALNKNGSKFMLYGFAGMNPDEINIKKDLHFLYLYAK